MKYQLVKYIINGQPILIIQLNLNEYVALKWIDLIKSKLVKGDINPNLYLKRNLNDTIKICKENSFDPDNMLTREEFLLLEGV